jgi:chromate reductase, NAD(P)H dehydrogenase (quinone)
MENKIKIIAFGASLRKESFSKIIMRETIGLCPPEGEVSTFDKLGEFPLFNQDLEIKMPSVVMEFKEKIKESDAVLIVTPEYNFSIPGYLKNALDWASRPYGDNSFDGKAAAIISASMGMLGGVKAQYALRQSSVFLNLHLLNKPEVIIPAVAEKIKDGKLVDEYTRQKITEVLTALCEWSKRF